MLQQFKLYLQLVVMPSIRKKNYLVFFSAYSSWYIYNNIIWYQTLKYDNTLPIYVKTNTYNINDVILYNYKKYIVVQQATNIDITNTGYFLKILDNNIGANVLKNIAPNGAQIEFILNLNFKGTYIGIFNASNSIKVQSNVLIFFGYIGDTLRTGADLGQNEGLFVGESGQSTQNVFTLTIKNYTNKPNENTIRNFLRKFVPLTITYNIIYL